MKKCVLLFCMSCSFFVPFHAYTQRSTEKNSTKNSEESIQQSTRQKRVHWSFGLDFVDFTLAFFEPDGIHVPVNIVAGYDFTGNFQAITSQIVRFPMRGGYVYIPTIGLRAHSNRIYGLTFFLGVDLGYKVTNVPWIKNGFLMKMNVGSRYVFDFKMYLEGGVGGNFAISANEMSPNYFLILGYML